MRNRRRSLRDRRSGRRFGIWGTAVALLLLLLACNLWFRQAPDDSATDVPLAALKAAFARVAPGETQASGLAKLGFDTSRDGARLLSYLGLMERFAPHDSIAFDALDPAAQKCLTTPQGCSAYLFRLARAHGSEERATFGFVNAAQAQAPGVMEVLFLIHDGRVVYKAMSGV